MRSRKLSLRLTAAFAISILTLLGTATPTVAQQETLLHSFPSSSKDGYNPDAGLIMDSAGNLYGTAVFGGPGTCPAFAGCGAVFELTPKAGGGWTEKLLHTFTANGKDGFNPYGSLMLDAAGNLYGTTDGGGIYGFGTVFELTPKAGGIWTEKVLHNFNNNGKDGLGPLAGLISDAAGNLYGTTGSGGSHGYGTVFELTPSTGSAGTEKILHNFANNGADGTTPEAPLIFDAAGNLYGTTAYGGAYGVGTAFMLKPSTGGAWSERNLHNFDINGTDGYYPSAGLVFDAAGNLYGTTFTGGANNLGTVFELALMANGNWHETLPHTFSFSETSTGMFDGSYPFAALASDGKGNFYGTTSTGGNSDQGAVFEMTPAAGGGWTEATIYSFTFDLNGTTDGGVPMAGLVFDTSGNLYGTTYFGGAYVSGQAGGTVFEITP
jgi:uncharacterized repeat protein (TIGR03803 family)